MQIEKSFSYQFEDPEWITKLGLGALISVVPVLNFAVAGYMVQIIRNVAAHAARPLPQWDDLEKKWTDGLMLFLAGLVYGLPAFILLCLPIGLLAASGGALANRDLQDIGTAMASAGGVLLAVAIFLLVIYSLVLSIIRPLIQVLFSRDGTLASCFRFREMVDILSRHTREFFITWLAVIVAGFAVGLIIGFINLVIGWVPCAGWAVGVLLGFGSAMYILSVDAHLFGQFRLAALGAQPSAAVLPDEAKSQQNPGTLSS